MAYRRFKLPTRASLALAESAALFLTRFGISGIRFSFMTRNEKGFSISAEALNMVGVERFELPTRASLVLVESAALF